MSNGGTQRRASVIRAGKRFFLFIIYYFIDKSSLLDKLALGNFSIQNDLPTTLLCELRVLQGFRRRRLQAATFYLLLLTDEVPYSNVAVKGII